MPQLCSTLPQPCPNHALTMPSDFLVILCSNHVLQPCPNRAPYSLPQAIKGHWLDCAQTVPQPCTKRACPNHASCPNHAPLISVLCPNGAPTMLQLYPNHAPTLPQPRFGRLPNCSTMFLDLQTLQYFGMIETWNFNLQWNYGMLLEFISIPDHVIQRSESSCHCSIGGRYKLPHFFWKFNVGCGREKFKFLTTSTKFICKY